jgi:hypothetical protein
MIIYSFCNPELNNKSGPGLVANLALHTDDKSVTGTSVKCGFTAAN